MNMTLRATNYSPRSLLLICAALALMPAISMSANKQIDLDLDVSRLAGLGQGDRGPVVISSVTDARSLSPAGTSDPALNNVLVGQYIKKQ